MIELVADTTPRARLRRGEAVRVGLRSAGERVSALGRAERIVYSATALYGIVFTLFAVAQHLAFRTARYDLGDYSQALWTTLHGNFLQITGGDGHQFNELAGHVEPVLLLLVPFWWVWPSPLMLVALQALAVSAGALPVFWLARKHLGNGRPAVFVTLAYLAFPAVQFNALAVSFDTGFHPVSLAIPLILLAVWFLDENRLVAFGVVARASPPPPRRRFRWRSASLPFGTPREAGAGASDCRSSRLARVSPCSTSSWAIPHFLGKSTVFGGWYAAVGGSPTGIARMAVTHPLTLVHAVTDHPQAPLRRAALRALPLPLVVRAAARARCGARSRHQPARKPVGPDEPHVPLFRRRGAVRRRRQHLRAGSHAAARAPALALHACRSPGDRCLLTVGHCRRKCPRGVRARRDSTCESRRRVPHTGRSTCCGFEPTRRTALQPPPDHALPQSVREARWIVADKADPFGRRSSAHHIALLRHDARWRLVYSSHGIFVFRHVA